MELYLIRHAPAVKLGVGGVAADEDRPLSEGGEARARRLARTFRQQEIRLDALVCTPYARAQRTAELMMEEWPGVAPELVVAKALIPECKPRKLARYLRELNKERVGIVGHQPDLGIWTAWLIGNKNTEIDFSKGGVAYINWEDKLKKGMGTLIWLITPKWYVRETEKETAPDPAVMV